MNKELKVGTIWFTGLSASGKSTLSTRLFNDLKSFGVENVTLLDGESIRDQLKNYSYDDTNREQIGYLKAELALKENKKGNIVLISGIASKKNWRTNTRKMIPNYYEVYLKCSVKKCAERDYKDHYSRAFAGEINNFVGVTEDYEEEINNVDLVLETEKLSIDECAKILFDKVISFLGYSQENYQSN